ncbi:hypothetical protein EYZ11_001131 [Aspergillus tanneri]|uniref:Exocyst complex component Sec3 PIP2-binding N-terminal domain-containing protein n=1 Tax=Aspergillus tanneri TaxID=1220188 RepID=A0A4S3JVH9_9EURO|nr:hypothetical protein EYZ11_001131 [Aspergillus tanneri]
MSRAEKFEDEKKRIIQSCFSKKDNDNTLIESYITHVRITEDAAYPSTPAPPTSPPENKKPRVIIVSVRRSGRVRMHKARENNDGSFSIGKTWMLDDLSSIQSYSALSPSSPMEQQQKQWASNLGFLVSVGKPYYWHARTSKEKEFFIGSLVKIYRKYTGGKLPDLIGFDDRERQLLSGSPATGPVAVGPSSANARGPTQGPARPEVAIPPPRPGSPQGARSQSPYSSRAQSRDGPRRLPSEDQALRAQRSREHMSRPSTGQSGRSGPPPFAPPQHPPPPFPVDQRNQPPPRSTERVAPENRMPKAPMHLPPEPPRDKDVPSSLLTSPPATQRDRPSGDFEESTSISSHQEARPPSSRDERSLPEPRPMLRTQDSSSSSPDTRRNKDGLRPNTPRSIPTDNNNITQSPGSNRGPNGDPAKSLAPEVQAEPRDNMTLASSVGVSSVNVPPTLKPASSRDVISPIAANTTTTPSNTKEAEPDEPVPDSVPISPPYSPLERSTASVDGDPDTHRPGLGPMITKKQSKDVVGTFLKPATTQGTFKPRPGGAGERLLAAAKKQRVEMTEPDGITGVVPAPFLRTNTDPANTTVPGTPDKETPPSPSPIASPAKEPPPVEVKQVAAVETPTISVDAPEEPRGTSRAAVKVFVDERTGVLEGRGVDFDDILTDLGWNGRLNDENKIEDLEADIRREIGRVEATSWLGNLEQQEGKVDQLARLIDKTVEECEELDNLLTLYSHELNTLHEDVSYIETQSQGLQVQTANQKLLHNELQNLLKTLSISSTDLRSLKEASLSNPDGLRDTETALSTLYKAMVMIDSNIWQNKKRLVDNAGDHLSVGVYADTEIGQMRAIKEKKEEYRFQSHTFLQRLKQFMAIAYKVAEQKRVDAASSGTKDPRKLDSEARSHFRRELWMYNALMLFAREVSGSEWQALISLYEQQARLPYQNEFRDNILAWKRAARKPTGEEQELLFTHQEKEKENESIAMAARKLTVRRGKTMKAAAGLRLSFGDKQHGKLEPCEAFAGTLHETLNMISEEQNFVLHYFHLSSLSSIDFPDLVASANPEDRRLPDFRTSQSHDPDRGMAKKVEHFMDELFAFWPTDMQNLVDWALHADPLQGIGILFALEKAMSKFDETNQDFVIHSLQKLHSRLVGLFNRFVDEQIRGIEETKVKVNKRKGVISFIRVFPHFSTAVESMLSQPSQEFCDIRVSVNEAYNRINQAMWESLKFIAKEAPGQATGTAAASGDPEDKEILNYHILLIENMNHYIEEVDVRGLPVLEKWRDLAHQVLREHMKLYLDSVIHRPLGRLLDFVESSEALLAANHNPTSIASRPSHSRSAAKKVLTTYDAKEIRRGIELLKKRVEKHFGDADDPGLSRSLVMKVLRECEGRYEEAYDRTRRVLNTVYDGQLDLEWRKEDVIAMFKK